MNSLATNIYIHITKNLTSTSDASHTVVPWCLELGSCKLITFRGNDKIKIKTCNYDNERTSSTWENWRWCPKSSREIAEVSGEFNLIPPIFEKISSKQSRHFLFHFFLLGIGISIADKTEGKMNHLSDKIKIRKFTYRPPSLAKDFQVEDKFLSVDDWNGRKYEVKPQREVTETKDWRGRRGTDFRRGRRLTSWTGTRWRTKQCITEHFLAPLQDSWARYLKAQQCIKEWLARCQYLSLGFNEPGAWWNFNDEITDSGNLYQGFKTQGPNNKCKLYEGDWKWDFLLEKAFFPSDLCRLPTD